jgi:hypothetical protein
MERSKTITSGLFCLLRRCLFAVFCLDARLEAIGQKGRRQHLPDRSAVIHHQNGFADAWLLGSVSRSIKPHFSGVEGSAPFSKYLLSTHDRDGKARSIKQTVYQTKSCPDWPLDEEK